MAKRRKSISPIFENAIDSLRIGMEFFQRESSYSSHKHAILTVFHAIELLLKERLHRTNRRGQAAPPNVPENRREG